MERSERPLLCAEHEHFLLLDSVDLLDMEVTGCDNLSVGGQTRGTTTADCSSDGAEWTSGIDSLLPVTICIDQK